MGKGWKTGEKDLLASPQNAFKRVVTTAGLVDLRIHDLRRTASSYMATEGISPTLLEQRVEYGLDSWTKTSKNISVMFLNFFFRSYVFYRSRAIMPSLITREGFLRESLSHWQQFL
jgi:hypothetical protein